MIEFSSVNIRTWSSAGASGTFGVAMSALAKQDQDLAVVTADLMYFSGLSNFANIYPNKFFNVGIAEQNMMGIASGMAKEGMNVWAVTYASFASTRIVDQIKVNMGYMKIPVRLVGLASGLSAGILGATHMAVGDIAIMRAIPNVVIMSPADCHEAMKMMMDASCMKEPVYIRLSGMLRSPIVYKEDYQLEIGKANCLLKKTDSKIVVFATGTMVKVSLDVANKLREKGIACDVYDFHTIRPLDVITVKQNLQKSLIVTIEEHSVTGGLGSAVAEIISLYPNSPKQLRLGVENFYPEAASYEYLLDRCGLTADKIVIRIEQSL